MTEATGTEDGKKTGTVLMGKGEPMRLIDKDRCKADIEQFNRPLCDGYHMKDYVLNQIITDIENQPTLDAVPVRHGKWIDRNCAIVAPFWERYECSECGARSDNSNYCPNCGARMDAERKEE